MHLLPATSVSLDEGEAAVDLRQPPGDIVVLSFADSDLAALAGVRQGSGRSGPSLRLASLRRLRHPLSIDLYVESTAAKARFVVVRCLGGRDYWCYGLERLSAACRAGGVKLAVLPGDDAPDPRLAAYATVSEALCDVLEAYFRAGGPDNMRRLLQRIGAEISGDGPSSEPAVAVGQAFAWTPEGGAQAPEAVLQQARRESPLVHLIVYRSTVLAGDTAPVESLVAALSRRGLDTLVLAVSSLKDPEAAAVVRRAIAARRPQAIVTTTAFASREDAAFVLDEADCPILQAIPVGSAQESWAASPRGLSAADLAMQVALPEFDGRIAAGPISFKAEMPEDPHLAFSRRVQAPDAAAVEAVADRAAAWIRLARTPRAARTLALVLSDYPARGGRAGFAVGLDTPASACAILDCLSAAGYAARRDFEADELMPRLSPLPPCGGELERGVSPTLARASPDMNGIGSPRVPLELAACCHGAIPPSLPSPARGEGGGVTEGEPSFAVPLAAYREWLDTLPPDRRTELYRTWGAPESDRAVSAGAFRFRAVRAGRVLVALQPGRSHAADRKAGYHDPDCPPSHAYLAFYLGLRVLERIDALVHLGTHGSTEWLPGKAVALSPTCWPRLCLGAVPVVYPFIVDDPGEAAPAKRRLGAVTVGHLTPPVADAGAHGEAAALRELVEEYSSAQLLDPRRAALVAADILERARASGLAAASGVDAATPIPEALTRLDAHLCDLGEVVFRDGLHVFGVAREGFEACAAGERDGLLAALDGRFVVPGPSGSPSRGRLDVLPTGRNLSTLDPRAIPTRAATELGWQAAAEVVRRHLQDEGDWPRRIVMDLWASPTLRSGGESVAQALAHMGVRPTWDHGSTRLTGFTIVPQPLLDQPRADVTVRVSGAFRDTFPDQVALIDQAARAVAALEEDDAWNALAAARRGNEAPARVFGAAPSVFGAGVSARALDGDWSARGDLGRTYLEATSHAYGPGGAGHADASFTRRVAQAQAFVHVTDVAERDVLEGDAAADTFGGFAAAAEELGTAPALYSLDCSRPNTPKARTLAEDVDRVLRGRLTHPRWIAGQLRHGWRGVAEIAQGVDALFAFAATSRAVTDAGFDLAFSALIGDEFVRAHMAQANPPAARAIRERFAEARRRGLWTSRLNSASALLDDGSAALPEVAA